MNYTKSFETFVAEAAVQVAGKNKPSGAKVLATVIIEHMMKENYLKPGADVAKSGLIDDIAKVIMDSTF
jgi:hypothetical protein